MFPRTLAVTLALRVQRVPVVSYLTVEESARAVAI